MITECTQDPSSSSDNFSNKEHTRKRLVRNIPATAIASPLQVPALDLKNEILFSYQERKQYRKENNTERCPIVSDPSFIS